jgi:hypothetical protein
MFASNELIGGAARRALPWQGCISGVPLPGQMASVDAAVRWHIKSLPGALGVQPFFLELDGSACGRTSPDGGQ